jgi:hypothetical protein
MVLLCNQGVDGGEAVNELIAGLTQAQASGQWLPNPLRSTRAICRRWMGFDTQSNIIQENIAYFDNNCIDSLLSKKLVN